jgi:FG-GAP-like repeat
MFPLKHLWLLRYLILIAVIECSLLCDICSLDAAEALEWVGQGKYRFLVEVPARDLKNRPSDKMPASVEVNFAKQLQKLKIPSGADLSTLQVIQYDSSTGQPVSGSQFSYGKGKYDTPFRWYDSAIPYEFPEFVNSIDRTKGKIIRKPVLRGGYFYNAIGDWKDGRLAWMHTQTGSKPSFYAVYFDLLPKGKKVTSVPPRAWLGDGLPRCAEKGIDSMGADHCRIELDDWNDDGLIDMIVGEQYGHLFWWPNCGTKTEPKYPYMKFLLDSNKQPMDVGWSSTPKVVDWDGDGVKDLLVGAEWNRILYYRNEGTNENRKLKYVGLLKADGKTLLLPIRPLMRGNEKIFKRDYYPVLETVDWDNDGDIDLLAGGYITGRIYFYENSGRKKEGQPELIFRGPLESDGKPINVQHWCASPNIADFDGDGDLDMISGNMPMTALGGDGDSDGTRSFLRYYKNNGNKKTPQLHEIPFPGKGNFPHSNLATSRSYDYDNDGDLDLYVSARSDLYMFENVGSVKSPQFQMHTKPLPSAWGAARIPGDQFLDYNKDGLPDLFKRNSYTIQLNTGKGNPWSWGQSIKLLPKGKHIAHASGIGDDWYWPFLYDLDQDGRLDILFGDWSGNVWFHKNLKNDPTDKTGHASIFDWKGKHLLLKSGQPIKVGPINKDINTDFEALQGARTVLTVADFDSDGLNDLVIGDTYGDVKYFRNSGTKEQPVFDEAIKLGNLKIRLLVDSSDWNGDGLTDIVAGAANGNVRVFLNTGKKGKDRFAEGFDPELPKIPQPRVLMTDINSDGDEDIFLPSTQGSCLVERSFLKHGYAKAKLGKLEVRP